MLMSRKRSAPSRSPLWASSAPQHLHLRPPGLDDPSVRNAGWAYGLARAAPEAEVDVLRLVFGERKRAALPLRHQIDAAAGRFCFQPCLPEGRARVQAEAAVHAGREVVIAQTRERLGRGGVAHTTNLPGLITWLGSNA